MGHQHPLISTLYRLCEIFAGMGYEVVTGPEVEWFDLNFTALNYPPDHPAMDDQDTFYVNDDIVLRTQTSPVQVRAMRAAHAADCPVRGLDPRLPPLEVLSHCRCTPRPTHVVAPGRTFRRESVTPTHNDIFHQLECLLVAPGVSFADLKGTVTEFARECFGPDTRTRFRPDFFPFTEPSADFSVSCELCEGARAVASARTAAGSRSVAPALVHPNVLRAGGYDPDKVSGFAFGFGIERIAQRRHRIEQIRHAVRERHAVPAAVLIAKRRKARRPRVDWQGPGGNSRGRRRRRSTMRSRSCMTGTRATTPTTWCSMPGEALAGGSPVLEIGAGTGRLTLGLAALGLEVVALDNSAAALRVLERKRACRPAASAARCRRWWPTCASSTSGGPSPECRCRSAPSCIC